MEMDDDYSTTFVEDDNSDYYSMTDSDDEHGNEGFIQFTQLLDGNVRVYCNDHDLDISEFSVFLNNNIVNIVRFIVNDIKLDKTITHNEYFEYAYQYVYDAYSEVFEDSEETELTEEQIQMIKIY